VPVEQPPAPALEPVTQGNLLEVLSTTGDLTVTRRRNKILRSRDNIYRVAVVDPSICDVVQFTPREVSIIGRGQGATNVTFWFADGKHKPLTYLVRVVPDPEVAVERERQYEIFEEVLAELFPDSKVRLTPVADKLIVRGQAKDAEEAAQILTIIRGEALAGRGPNAGYNANTLIEGQAAAPLSADATGNNLPASNIVNMLRIPGVQQVALRVKIAELNRSAARHFGVNLDMQFEVGNGALLLQSLLNPPGTASIIGSFDNNQINFGIHYLKKHGVLRILSEPTLVTLSGRPASFVAGGEFAVPTTVGVDGAAAVTTDFRAFGVILNFLPTVIDKDRLRLEISPEFSKVNEDLNVGGTPGLTTRAVTTTVEMREGQSLAIAGLLEDSMEAKKEGDLPFLSSVFGRREVARNETELIILVTPELVHPLDPEEVPPLPGFDVTEPTDVQFFLAGRLEGTPTQEMRSTVWPRLRNRYRHGGPAMISGPFGHGQ
jgi:pilus assembly protein CpaC